MGKNYPIAIPNYAINLQVILNLSIFLCFIYCLFVCLPNLGSLVAKSWYYNKIISGVNIIWLRYISKRLIIVSPHVSESKAVLESWFHAVDSRFQVLDFWFWIPIFIAIRILYALFWIPKIRIRDSTRKITDPGSGLPYWGELLDEVEKQTHSESKNKNNG